MSTLLPVKIKGTRATFVAQLDDGEIFEQTYGLDDVTRQNVAAASAEFQLLVADRDVGKEKQEDPKAGTTFVDPVSGDPVDDRSARDAYANLAPREEATSREEE